LPSKLPTYRPKNHAAAEASARRSYERRAPRLEDKRFYASARWRAARLAYLQSHPTCERCSRLGRLVEAKHVHHKVERKAAPELAFDPSNFESLCVPCHSTHATFGRVPLADSATLPASPQPPGGGVLLPARKG
jgi:5-methylcytosine-specific restriction endonuclease McrA